MASASPSSHEAFFADSHSLARQTGWRDVIVEGNFFLRVKKTNIVINQPRVILRVSDYSIDGIRDGGLVVIPVVLVGVEGEVRPVSGGAAVAGGEDEVRVDDGSRTPTSEEGVRSGTLDDIIIFNLNFIAKLQKYLASGL